MANRSDKKAWPKTANVGCMMGLISMFSFRRFTSRQVLVSQNQRNGRRQFGKWYSRSRMKLLTNSEGKSEHLASVDADGTKNGHLGAESVKNLMNKEMSTSKQSQRNSNAERRKIIYQSGECLEKNHSPLDKCLEVDKTRDTNELSFHKIVGPYRKLFENVTEKISNIFDVAVLVNDMEGSKRSHHNMHQDSAKDEGAYIPFLEQINGEAFLDLSFFQKMLCETLENELRCKFPGAVRTSPKDVSNPSGDLRHSLEISVPYIQIFLDALVRVVQNSANNQSEPSNIKHIENGMDSSKQEISSSYPPKKEKNLMNEPSYRQSTMVNDKSQSSSRIVILKPNPRKSKSASSGTNPSSQEYSSGLQPEENDTVKSHLFVQDVKRRLAHLLEDKREDISHDVEIEDLGASCHGSSEASNNTVKRSQVEKQKEISPTIGSEVGSVENHRCNNVAAAAPGTATFSLGTESDFLLTFRKAESGDGSANIEKKGDRSLRKLLSLPADCKADLRYGSEKDTVPPFSSQHVRARTWSSEHDVDLKLASQLSRNPDDALQTTDTVRCLSSVVKDEIPSEVTLPLEGLMKCGGNESLLLEKGSIAEGDASTEIEDYSIVTLPESFRSPRLGSLEEKSHLLYPSSPTMFDALVIHSPEVNESMGDKHERPSPISVLETSAIDDMRRPESTFTVNESYPRFFKLAPRHIYFEDSDDSTGFLQKSSPQTHLRSCMEDEKFKYGYVRSLLEAAGLSSYPLSIKPQLSHPLLDPSLYDEVETPCEEIPDDLKLFFDCVGDVVEEIYERCSGSKPWVYFAKPEVRGFPHGEKLVAEVVRRLNCLYVLRSPKSFEEIVQRELENGPWMDIRAAVEHFGLEVGQAILELLLEETVLELWD